MTPGEVIQSLFELGICYQIGMKQQPGLFDILKPPQMTENFEDLGFNKDKPEEEEETENSIYDSMYVITDIDRLTASACQATFAKVLLK